MYVTTRDAEQRWSAPRRIAQGLYVRWSPAGPQLAFIDQLFGGSVFVINADGSALHRVFDGTQPGGARAVAIAWSEDGRDVYVKAANAAGNTEVWAASAQGGEPRRLTALGDSRRRSDQYDLDVARARIYFVLKELESDVWVIDVAPR